MLKNLLDHVEYLENQVEAFDAQIETDFGELPGMSLSNAVEP